MSTQLRAVAIILTNDPFSLGVFVPTETTPVAICLTIAVWPKEGLITIPN